MHESTKCQPELLNRPKNLLEYDSNQLAALRQRIVSANGMVDILVHPFFKEVDPHRPASSDYIDKRNRRLSESAQNPVLLIIFEEYDQLPTLEQNNGHIPLIVVPTKSENPTPYVQGLDPLVTDDENAWKTMVRLFQTLEIKHIRLGGRYMSFAALEDGEGIPNDDMLVLLNELKTLAHHLPNAQAWLEEGVLPFGCAGRAAQVFIRNGFDVTISDIASPDNLPGDISTYD